MNKADFIEAVAKTAQVSKKDASATVDAVFGTITEVLKNGDSIRVPGFGTFETRQKPERSARNPRTGETLVVPAATVPAFKAGKELKTAVNK